MNAFRAERYLRQFVDNEAGVVNRIERSFLSEHAKAEFLARFRDRLMAITD